MKFDGGMESGGGGMESGGGQRTNHSNFGGSPVEIRVQEVLKDMKQSVAFTMWQHYS